MSCCVDGLIRSSAAFQSVTQAAAYIIFMGESTVAAFTQELHSANPSPPPPITTFSLSLTNLKRRAPADACRKCARETDFYEPVRFRYKRIIEIGPSVVLTITCKHKIEQTVEPLSCQTSALPSIPISIHNYSLCRCPECPTAVFAIRRCDIFKRASQLLDERTADRLRVPFGRSACFGAT